MKKRKIEERTKETQYLGMSSETACNGNTIRTTFGISAGPAIQRLNEWTFPCQSNWQLTRKEPDKTKQEETKSDGPLLGGCRLSFD